MVCYIEFNHTNHTYLSCVLYYLVFCYAKHPVPAVWLSMRKAMSDIGSFGSSANTGLNRSAVICKACIGIVVVVIVVFAGFPQCATAMCDGSIGAVPPFLFYLLK